MGSRGDAWLAGPRHAGHPCMGMAQRAKIFTPFTPLAGFNQALRERERRGAEVGRAELSPEWRARLDAIVTSLVSGDIVTVEYFDAGEYMSLRGAFEGVLQEGRAIEVAGRTLPIAAIRDIWRL